MALNEKGGEFDMVATDLREETFEYLKGMQDYIERIKQMSTDDAEKFCYLSLYKSGVLDEGGGTKKKIVSWE